MLSFLSLVSITRQHTDARDIIAIICLSASFQYSMETA